MNLLPRMPKIADFFAGMPKMPKAPNVNLFTRSLQGFHGITQGYLGKYAQTIRPTKDNGGK